MKSFLVIGMGQFGSSVAKELYLMKHDVLVVDSHEEKIAPYMNNVTNAIIGDTTDEAVLRSLGVQNFDCVVVGISQDIQNSIWTLMILKELDAKMIVCKARDERHAKILSQLGADKVIRPEFDMGIRIAHSLAQKNVIDFLEISVDHSVVEISIPAEWVGKSILKIHLRKKYGITVICIRNGDTGAINFSPEAETVLSKNDIITVIGRKKNLNKIQALS
ncbi:MAG: TrkA family potassium uptake protein [Turicibacter sp.]|nr:TrkA family potassium uptake protein [Turicibacter sp.]